MSISDYQILRTLGSGATGKVKLARHPHTNELVALKIIRKDLLDRKRDLYTKVRKEIALMKLIAANCLVVESQQDEMAAFLPTLLPDAHIGVMKLLDVYDTNTSFVLVLEHCDGGELFDLLIEQGYLPQAQVLDLFQQLVYALEFCHNRGICHRDLKPENVLLMADGRVKLADFGMGSLLTRGALMDTACGSPQYCAPEVISGDQYVGEAADIWSLGVVLYAMTTGGLPFDDDNLHRLIAKINSGAFYVPEAVPDDLAALIQAMLTVDPKKRITLESIKKSDWFLSQPCRHDIYIDRTSGYVQSLEIEDDQPVVQPEREIVRYLTDLGFGDSPMILRRLAAKEQCVERIFYYQLLHLCEESLALQTGEDLPPSPKQAVSVSIRQGRTGRKVHNQGSPRSVEETAGVTRRDNAQVADTANGRSLVEELVAAMVSRGAERPVTQAMAEVRHVSSRASVASIPPLRSVMTM